MSEDADTLGRILGRSDAIAEREKCKSEAALDFSIGGGMSFAWGLRIEQLEPKPYSFAPSALAFALRYFLGFALS